MDGTPPVSDSFKRGSNGRQLASDEGGVECDIVIFLSDLVEILGELSDA